MVRVGLEAKEEHCVLVLNILGKMKKIETSAFESLKQKLELL